MYRNAQVVPPEPLLKHFDAHASALADELISPIRSPRTLAALRDVLLPKLVSGELRVRGIGQLVTSTV